MRPEDIEKIHKIVNQYSKDIIGMENKLNELYALFSNNDKNGKSDNISLYEEVFSERVNMDKELDKIIASLDIYIQSVESLKLNRTSNKFIKGRLEDMKKRLKNHVDFAPLNDCKDSESEEEIKETSASTKIKK